jgi:hypothetical protein
MYLFILRKYKCKITSFLFLLEIPNIKYSKEPFRVKSERERVLPMMIVLYTFVH